MTPSPHTPNSTRKPIPARIDVRTPTLDRDELLSLCLECGADDAGCVPVDAPGLEDQQREALAFFPRARTFISIVCRMNREPLRSLSRATSNLEFHAAGDHVNEVGRRIVRALENRGVRAINPAMGFPMDMEKWPGKTWPLSHKPIAEAAGMGKMGIHRCVIHPKLGSMILLGTVVIDAAVDAHSTPIDFNPCVTCKLCVAACPTGAIKPDGAFDASACYTHNYREFMSGFSDWVETVADSSSAREYRRRVEDRETVSMWQSLGFGPNYKAAYCIAVCPAGTDLIDSFTNDKKGFIKEIVEPFQQREETVYAVKGSDTPAHVAKRFPRKRVKVVSNGIRPRTVESFLLGLRIGFQRGASQGLNAVYHFVFRGSSAESATVTIRDQTCRVEPGLIGTPDLTLRADAESWLAFLRKEKSLPLLLLRGKLRLKGDPRLLMRFGACFPL